jgi:hypothetical protein
MGWLQVLGQLPHLVFSLFVLRFDVCIYIEMVAVFHVQLANMRTVFSAATLRSSV